MYRTCYPIANETNVANTVKRAIGVVARRVTTAVACPYFTFIYIWNITLTTKTIIDFCKSVKSHGMLIMQCNNIPKTYPCNVMMSFRVISWWVSKGLPLHVTPSPVKPMLQKQWNEPLVLIHDAWMSQW